MCVFVFVCKLFLSSLFGEKKAGNKRRPMFFQGKKAKQKSLLNLSFLGRPAFSFAEEAGEVHTFYIKSKGGIPFLFDKSCERTV